MLVYIRETDKDKIICNVDEKDIAEHLLVRFCSECKVGYFMILSRNLILVYVLRLNSRINPVNFICLNKKKNEIQIKQAYAFSLTYLVILFCFIFFLTVIEKFNFFIYFRLALSYLDTLQNGHLSVNCTYLFYLFTISLCIYLHAAV